MTVYCVMEHDRRTPWEAHALDALCSIWRNKDKAEAEATKLNLDYPDRFRHYVTEEQVR